MVWLKAIPIKVIAKEAKNSIINIVSMARLTLSYCLAPKYWEIIIVEPEELPLEYRVERITYTPNKRALKEANNQGIDISNIAEIDPNLKPQFKLNSR